MKKNKFNPLTCFAGFVLFAVCIGSSCFCQITDFSGRHMKMSKSSATIKQRLDSMVNESYNVEKSKWIADEKKTYTYDTMGNNIRYLVSKWDTTSSQWIDDNKLEYTHDTYGNVVQYIDYYWNKSTSQWITGTKFEQAYDANGNMTQEVRYSWIKESSEWLWYYKEEYIYNADDELTQCTHLNWDEVAGEWVKYYLEEWSYDDNGNRILWACYSWDKPSGEWTIYWKEEITFDENNHKTQYIDYNYDKPSDQWTNSWKGVYDYDGGENITQYEGMKWDTVTSQWIKNVKLNYVYDTDGNMITFVLQCDWDTTTATWFEAGQEGYTYDNNYVPEDLILPYLFGTGDENFTFIHQLLTKTIYDWTDSTAQWSAFKISTCYYSEQDIASVFSHDNTGFLIYPNPANGFVIIDADDPLAVFELYDMQGRKVISQPLNGSSQVQVSQLKEGVYLYRVESSSGMFSGKVVICNSEK
ncbi:MAG: T9SS type A sorting domain-containing protein [Bacteroidales bacterium]|nr:T9SS type A sorting domain-containing protein [Bacteroidales bacterium]